MKALLSQDVKALILFTWSAGSIAVAVTTGAVLPDLVLPVCGWHCCLEHYFLETLPCQDFLDCTFARVDSLRTVLDKNKVTFADELSFFGQHVVIICNRWPAPCLKLLRKSQCNLSAWLESFSCCMVAVLWTILFQLAAAKRALGENQEQDGSGLIGRKRKVIGRGKEKRKTGGPLPSPETRSNLFTGPLQRWGNNARRKIKEIFPTPIKKKFISTCRSKVKPTLKWKSFT